MSVLLLLAAAFALRQVSSFPQCSGNGSQPIYGGLDPATCGGPLDPYGKPWTPYCGFQAANLAGEWYQQYASTATEKAISFQEGQECIHTSYTVVGNNFTVTHTGQLASGELITYGGWGSSYAVVNFPGKLTTFYPRSPELFPTLTYVINHVQYETRPQYVVRRYGNNNWMMFSDFQCETFFVITRSPQPSDFDLANIQSAMESLGHGPNMRPIHQGNDCWYAQPTGQRPTSSTGTSSTGTSGTTSATTSSSSVSSSATSSSSSSGSSTSATSSSASSSLSSGNAVSSASGTPSNDSQDFSGSTTLPASVFTAFVLIAAVLSL
eukprot:TRINITY_DN27881_c0_g1_i1.p1 TRINITY_DN27881_c0_g1~~TRINITY_DN27881_c0_g1_i1.p1  ORF type:complete len:323 (-),score=73.66 TRINITY_DN27881_c0_g1_i1:713-1681(-)